MTTVRLAYGDTGLDLVIDPAVTTVVTPVHHPVTEPAEVLLRRALRAPVAGPPLRERVRPGQRVAISACDGTRPQPRELMIPAILEELDGLVRLEDVVILVATGTHRGNSEPELRAMFGDEVVDTVRIVNHDARDRASLTWVGRHGDDVPVWLNSEWVEADVRITTGFVEPHFFAGFSACDPSAATTTPATPEPARPRRATSVKATMGSAQEQPQLRRTGRHTASCSSDRATTAEVTVPR